MVELNNVSFIRDNRYILKDISISIDRGQNWVILGKNGSGKTTLINALRNLITGKANKTNNVTYGQTDGYLKGEIND